MTDELDLRALMPDDAGSARALVSRRFGGSRYESRFLEQLDSALAFEDPEYVALLALDPAGALVGLALFGAVAGARGVVKVHAVVGGERDVLLTLLDAIRRVAVDSGERMIVAELPDDAPFETASAALDDAGFREEGRVADFVRDGVALRLLVRRLGSGLPARS